MDTFYAEGNKLSTEIKNYYKGGISYSAIMKLFRKKDVKLCGKRIGEDVKTEKGDKIEVYYEKSKRKIKVLYEDENLVAAYKPKGETFDEFERAVKETYPSAEAVHRLDRNTDGIMVFALSEKAKDELLRAFKERTVKKYYSAEVYGKMKKPEDTLVAYLEKDEKNAKVRIYPTKRQGASEIITKYKVIEEYPETSLLEVELVTGKTHQIRAHLANEGNFIIGDGKYGVESVNRKFHAKTQRLTANKVVFSFDEKDFLGYLNGKEIVLSEDAKNENKK